jgi:predicted enzyme involved in methoxymalonyl-ACP biosynthesis
MSVIELLSRLRNLNIELWVDDDRLRFSAPPGALSPELRAALVEHKAEVLAFLRRNPASTEAAQPIPPISRNQPLPLSFAQQRMWFFEKLEPGTSTYHMVAAIRLIGCLNRVALEQSFNSIVRRHETLRTSFTTLNGQPVQIISPHLIIPLVVIDLRSLDEAECETKMSQLIADEGEKPFDLAQLPLLRTTLLYRSENDYVLLLTMHHIVSDIWSIGVFIRELMFFYKRTICTPDAITNQLESLPSLPVQYADFAVWQRQWLQGPILKEQLAYWKQQLGGALPTLELPTDHPRPAIKTFPGAHQVLVLPKRLVQALGSLCKREGVTLFMMLLATFNTLLFRYTGQTEILVGSPIANRTRIEIEGLIGFFANTLVLRTDLSGNPTFVQLLKRVREVTLGAYEHQDLPFEQLVEALRPKRDPSRTPLFQVMFVLQNATIPAFDMPNLAFHFLEPEREMAQFDLNLSVTESDDELVLSLIYNTDLFNANTVKDMLENYQVLLETVVTHAHEHLSMVVTHIPMQKLNIVVAATFTIEPLEDSLTFFMDKLAIPYQIQFAPYNQLFQQLLDPESCLASNHAGVNIILVRLEDWVRLDEKNSVEFSVLLEQNIQNFVGALISFRESCVTPSLLYICPPSDSMLADTERNTILLHMENQIVQQVRSIPGIDVLQVREIARMYDLAQINDPYADKLGRVPYIAECFAVLGISMARYIFALSNAGYYAILLDCDQTLWSGYADNDEPIDMHIQQAYMALQEFMVRQYATGKVLCLCSDNNEDDVIGVFRNNRSMPLKLIHFVSWRIDWCTIPEKINALAKELHLALDSLIYISANPVACTIVRAICPTVLTLQLPPDPESFMGFLNNVWAFDPRGVFDEA